MTSPFSDEKNWSLENPSNPQEESKGKKPRKIKKPTKSKNEPTTYTCDFMLCEEPAGVEKIDGQRVCPEHQMNIYFSLKNDPKHPKLKKPTPKK